VAAPIAVLLGQFEDLIAHGMRSILAADDLVELLATDIPMNALEGMVAEIEPDVVVLDRRRLSSPVQVNDLVKAQPETAFVVVIGSASAEEASQLIAFGAMGVIAKDIDAEDLRTAVRMASRGMRVMPGFRGGLEPQRAFPDILTPREAEVLELLQRGRSNAEVANELSLGIETVRTHVRNILRKLGVSSRKELAAFGPF
jgi:NarL family two-component system response regulator LiaR